MDQENETRILEMLAKNEKLVSDLYKIYSEKFPGYEDFWLGLSVEETEHATWIYELNKKVKEGQVSFKKERFNLYAVENFRNYMKEMLTASQKQEITLESALSNSLNIESALLERKFFEVFESDAGEIKEVLNLLEVSTKKHLGRVKDAWNKIKQ